jgi:prepilin-type N-terminal cleavage/methylation domain-containing protein
VAADMTARGIHGASADFPTLSPWNTTPDSFWQMRAPPFSWQPPSHAKCPISNNYTSGPLPCELGPIHAHPTNAPEETATVNMRDQSGMTMVEVLSVVLIVAVLAAMSLPAAGLLQSALRAMRAKSASDELVAALRNTRQQAISQAENRCIALRNVSGTAEYEIYSGTRSGTTCAGTSIEGPTSVSGSATIDTARAFAFTPVSTVSPVGPTSIVVTGTSGGIDCSVTLTVTPEGGVQEPGTNC